MVLIGRVVLFAKDLDGLESNFDATLVSEQTPRFSINGQEQAEQLDHQALVLVVGPIDGVQLPRQRPHNLLGHFEGLAGVGQQPAEAGQDVVQGTVLGVDAVVQLGDEAQPADHEVVVLRQLLADPTVFF